MSNSETIETPVDAPAREVTTIYTRPECPQCDQTKAFMDRSGIPYTAVDLMESPDDMAAIKALGYAAAPVVITERPGEEAVHWSGINNYELQALKARRRMDLKSAE